MIQLSEVFHANQARHKRRRQPDQMLAVVHSIAPDLLDRRFEATGPNQKWAANLTYVWTAEGWLFVAVVLDLYSRRVVGWSMQPTMTAELVMDAVLHHSDQGSRGEFTQYTSEDFQRLLDSHGITCSMSRRGNCWDNAAMESFFSTLKNERLSRKQYRTHDNLRADVFDCIERFYNPKRRHSTIGYTSPVQIQNQQSAQRMCPWNWGKPEYHVSNMDAQGRTTVTRRVLGCRSSSR